MIVASCYFCCYFYFCVAIFFWVCWKKIFLLFLGYSFPLFPSIISCSAGFVERYCVNLFLSWNILVTESFAGHSSLGCHLCSLRDCITSALDLLAFMISGEKSGIILIGLPLYVTWPFSFTAFNTHSLFCAFGVLTIIWQEEFLF